MSRFIASVGFLLCWTVSAFSADLTLIAWNVESDFPGGSADDPHDGNDPATIANELTQLVDSHDANIVGLTEVKPSTFLQFRTGIQNGLDSNVDFVTTGSGGDDSMMIVADADRFDMVESFELHRYEDHLGNANNLGTGALRFRSPLVVRFRDHENDDLEFFVVINHLARGDDSMRLSQAKMLREWASDQTLPVVVMGDMNFDYEIADDQGNASMQAFMENDVFEWLKPDPLVDTNWADVDPTKPLADRTDQFPNSILDFVFVAKGAKDWDAESDVIVRDGDLPDTGATSDHRPVKATVSFD